MGSPRQFTPDNLPSLFHDSISAHDGISPVLVWLDLLLSGSDLLRDRRLSNHRGAQAWK